MEHDDVLVVVADVAVVVVDFCGLLPPLRLSMTAFIHFASLKANFFGLLVMLCRGLDSTVLICNTGGK